MRLSETEMNTIEKMMPAGAGFVIVIYDGQGIYQGGSLNKEIVPAILRQAADNWEETPTTYIRKPFRSN